VAIPSGYPTESSDEDIKSTMSAVLETMRQGVVSINAVMQNAPLIGLGQTELMSRSVERSGRNSSRFAKVAISLAVISLAVTAYFGYRDFQSDKEWQREQLIELRNIKTELGRRNVP
jgi:hypothetical protein